MEKSFTNKLDGYAQATFKDLAKTFEVVSEQLEHGRGIKVYLPSFVPHKYRPLLGPFTDTWDDLVNENGEF